jgi:hypothetical protein
MPFSWWYVSDTEIGMGNEWGKKTAHRKWKRKLLKSRIIKIWTTIWP